ncbi:hypothetical protein M427DRAFT_44507 [Gonapodya prolifera JEL478]|uniref:Uncharacterized protein n=1 Tax=Gonapodya prolifera (strain JEL478) TaxID=1344416 RepID=A0A139AFW2_GONPJ|nr:hypothetical protein M427DRAFT_44507 [Gonapodya prolifera JEL478]|eukprot:KXS15454.1 hypothetical protein M427DRAFT_44507 [Gonapodya prolifera JEL478]
MNLVDVNTYALSKPLLCQSSASRGFDTKASGGVGLGAKKLPRVAIRPSENDNKHLAERSKNKTVTVLAHDLHDPTDAIQATGVKGVDKAVQDSSPCGPWTDPAAMSVPTPGKESFSSDERKTVPSRFMLLDDRMFNRPCVSYRIANASSPIFSLVHGISLTTHTIACEDHAVERLGMSSEFECREELKHFGVGVRIYVRVRAHVAQIRLPVKTFGVSVLAYDRTADLTTTEQTEVGEGRWCPSTTAEQKLEEEWQEMCAQAVVKQQAPLIKKDLLAPLWAHDCFPGVYPDHLRPKRFRQRETFTPEM